MFVVFQRWLSKKYENAKKLEIQFRRWFLFCHFNDRDRFLAIWITSILKRQSKRVPWRIKKATRIDASWKPPKLIQLGSSSSLMSCANTFPHKRVEVLHRKSEAGAFASTIAGGKSLSDVIDPQSSINAISYYTVSVFGLEISEARLSRIVYSSDSTVQ